VDEAVRRLRREGYLDDAGFAARFARSRIAGHGLGRHRVRGALRTRGVAREVAEAGLARALAEVSEAEGLDAAARRFWRARVRDEPRTRLRKLWAFLLRRGFPAGLVGERLRALWPRYRDALDGLEPAEPHEGHEGHDGPVGHDDDESTGAR
jgi:regulatory protein